MAVQPKIYFKKSFTPKTSRRPHQKLRGKPVLFARLLDTFTRPHTVFASLPDRFEASRARFGGKLMSYARPHDKFGGKRNRFGGKFIKCEGKSIKCESGNR